MNKGRSRGGVIQTEDMVAELVVAGLLLCLLIIGVRGLSMYCMYHGCTCCDVSVRDVRTLSIRNM